MRKLDLFFLCGFFLFVSTCLVYSQESDYCKTCGNKGHITCPLCKGRKKISGVNLICPECKGKKVVECTHCDEEGMMRCDNKCRLFKGKDENLNGKYVIINPEWLKYESPFKKQKDIEKQKEIDKYIICPDCEGTGKVKCKYCDGTRQVKCRKCNGKGTIRGFGECPRCNGVGEIACPDCAELPSIATEEDKEDLKKLIKIYKQRLLDASRSKNEKLYWQRRRALVAQVKERSKNKSIKMNRKDDSGVKNNKTEHFGGINKGRAKSPLDFYEDRLEKRSAKLKSLAEAFSEKLITVNIYHKRKRSLGLKRKDIETVEKEIASSSPRMKEYTRLENDFVQGRLDKSEFDAKLSELDK